MNYSILAILLTSLLGSLHCVGMCGGFAAYATEQRSYGILYYHLGRLLTYLLLGLAAGALGSALNGLGVVGGLSQLAALVVGILMISCGLYSFFSISAVGKIHSKYMAVPYRKILEIGDRSPTYLRPFIFGLASTFLPCGWLYSYVAIAASTGSFLSAIVTMIFFWLGTVPILTGVGVFSRVLLVRLGNFAIYAPGLILILGGTFSLLAHFSHEHHGSHMHSHIPQNESVSVLDGPDDFASHGKHVGHHH